MNTIHALDLELKNRFWEEMNILKEYEITLTSMTIDEKKELLEWMAHGRSVNSNPYMLYGENGSLLDLIAATRLDEDMRDNPYDYLQTNEDESAPPDEEIPF
jgi:hypothetical protein